MEDLDPGSKKTDAELQVHIDNVWADERSDYRDDCSWCVEARRRGLKVSREESR